MKKEAEQNERGRFAPLLFCANPVPNRTCALYLLYIPKTPSPKRTVRTGFLCRCEESETGYTFQKKALYGGKSHPS